MSYIYLPVSETLNDKRKLILYRVSFDEAFDRQYLEEKKRGFMYFTDDLSYYKWSATRYEAKYAKKFEFDLEAAKVFDPMKDWSGIYSQAWSDIRAPVMVFDKHGFYDYENISLLNSGELTDDDEGMTCTEDLAEYGFDHGYDITILRDIPTDGGPSFTEYCVHSPNRLRKIQ